MSGNELAEQLKYWMPMVGAASIVWKAAEWLKGLGAKLDRIESNHLTHIEADMKKLPELIEEQTEAIVDELRRIRTEDALRKLAGPAQPTDNTVRDAFSDMVSELRTIGREMKAAGQAPAVAPVVSTTTVHAPEAVIGMSELIKEIRGMREDQREHRGRAR